MKLYDALYHVYPWSMRYKLKDVIRDGVYIKDRDLTLSNPSDVVHEGEQMKIGQQVWTAHDFSHIQPETKVSDGMSLFDFESY